MIQSPSSSGLGRQPFTLVTRVQIPLGAPYISLNGGMVDTGDLKSLARKGVSVRVRLRAQVQPYSAVGRASLLHSDGRGFESLCGYKWGIV